MTCPRQHMVHSFLQGVFISHVAPGTRWIATQLLGSAPKPGIRTLDRMPQMGPSAGETLSAEPGGHAEEAPRDPGPGRFGALSVGLQKGGETGGRSGPAGRHDLLPSESASSSTLPQMTVLRTSSTLTWQ